MTCDINVIFITFVYHSFSVAYAKVIILQVFTLNFLKLCMTDVFDLFAYAIFGIVA